jgi:hypothetical protein
MHGTDVTTRVQALEEVFGGYSGLVFVDIAPPHSTAGAFAGVELLTRRQPFPSHRWRRQPFSGRSKAAGSRALATSSGNGTSSRSSSTGCSRPLHRQAAAANAPQQ